MHLFHSFDQNVFYSVWKKRSNFYESFCLHITALFSFGYMKNHMREGFSLGSFFGYEKKEAINIHNSRFHIFDSFQNSFVYCIVLEHSINHLLARLISTSSMLFIPLFPSTRKVNFEKSYLKHQGLIWASLFVYFINLCMLETVVFFISFLGLKWWLILRWLTTKKTRQIVRANTEKGNLFNSLVNWKMLERGRTVSPWPSSVLRFSIFWRLLTRPLKLLAMTHHFPCFLCHILCWFLWEKFTTLLFLWRKFSFIFDLDWVWLNGHVSRCYECYFWAVTLKNSCPDFTLKNGENRDKYEWAAA